VTDQESNSSSPPDLPASDSEVHRYTLVAACGIMGTEDDCRRFMELMVEDFQRRVVRANDKIMKGRITILPLEETIDTDAEV
jgi:hypothetical protein